VDAKITIADLLTSKHQNRKIIAVSCYDYTTAKLVSQTDVRMILVGDSAAQAVLGFDSTLPATMDFMVAITAAVRRGAPMIKIEVSGAYVDVVKAVSDAGMAVMAHIGIRPQSISKIGKFKAEATTAEMAAELVSLAEQMINAGAGSLLIEGTAAEVAEIITKRSEVPVVGCGSGPDCDGQILIAPDILGLVQGPSPKFAKGYSNLAEATVEAFKKYTKEVESGEFPDEGHSYHMKKGELERLKELLK